MMKNNLFRKPVTWIVIVAIALISAIYAFNNFEKANPIVGLDIKMNRETALNAAEQLKNKFSLGPEAYKTAAIFLNDNTFQNFVELEAGGLEKFTEVIESGLYSSYKWRVRHFKEHEPNEVIFSFTPAGDIYGFSEKLADSEEGAALAEDEALKIAKEEAQKHWNVKFDGYKLVEKSKEEVESGRIDHTFVYERQDEQIGDGKYRLQLRVSGDKLTQIRHFVKIPEEFNRRYSEMRSANDTVALFGSVGLLVIYGLGGVFVGLFFLLRRRRLIWKPAVKWGILIALGSVFLVTINRIPLSWFNYDTSASAGSFLSNSIINGFLMALGMGALFALTFMVAEGLGRSAFPRHVQLWKAWGNKTGGSFSLLGQTMAGYLFMVIMIGIDILFYVVTKRFGWWSPAGNLSDPNILATYMPWFNSIGISLQAGFWEEALCRAVPLAGIVLLTRKSKFKNFWIILVLVVQTLIFGAAHANYPQQPAYARIIEMIVPFTIIGLIYLGYGLIPVIISHFTVDVFWFSLPLWVADSPGIWTDRIMVLLLLFIPLWIVLYFRIKNRKFTEVPDNLRNSGWEPPVKTEKEAEKEMEIVPEKKSYTKFLIPAGIAGLLLWLLFTPFKQDVSKLKVTKEKTCELAINKLKEKFNIDNEKWKVLTSISDNAGLQHKFIWQEAGEKNYEKYLGGFLSPPVWSVRLVKTEGEVEERTEEYIANIDISGNVRSYSHKIPEKRKGAFLDRKDAQAVADSALIEVTGLKRENLKEISVTPKKLDNRKDWTFVYADTINYTLDKGQGRYRILIAGDELASVSSFVHVPEEWNREYEDRQSKRKVLRTTGGGFSIVLVIAGIIWGIVRWTRRKFSARLFLLFSSGLLLFFIINNFLTWDSVIFAYQTSLPWSNFITMMVILMGMGGLFSSAGLGIIGGMSVKLADTKVTDKYNWLKAIGLGMALFGLNALLSEFEAKTAPFWANFDASNSKLPVISTGIGSIQGYVGTTGVLLILFFGLHTFTNKWTKSKWLFGGLTILVGILIQAASLENYIFWVVSGLLTGFVLLALYILFIRYHFEWLPLIAAVAVILGILQSIIIGAVPSVLAGGIIGILIIILIAWWWYSEFLRE